MRSIVGYEQYPGIITKMASCWEIFLEEVYLEDFYSGKTGNHSHKAQ
jgi:hypothetical protein